MLTLETLDFVTSDRARQILAQLATEDLSESRSLPLIEHLRRICDDSTQASALLSLARLRQKGAAKFGPDVAHLYFTADALEQASDPLVRQYRAERIRHASIIDICCGIGTDSLAFVAAGHAVLGIDLDPLRIELARLNAEALGLNTHFEQADARTFEPDPDAFVFYDPARRDESGRRIHHVEQYIPPLSLVDHWRPRPVAVKLSPGVDLDQLETCAGAVEFISVGGDLKEALLWLDGTQGRRATLLTPEGTYHWPDTSEPDISTQEPRAWLVEPDPALLRAGQVRSIAAAFDGTLLDPTIAYFTCDQQPQSPWLRAWRIRAWMPYHLKRLRAALKERGITRVTVKKRGSPITPEALTAGLRLRGSGDACTLVLTRFEGQPIVIICDEMPA